MISLSLHSSPLTLVFDWGGALTEDFTEQAGRYPIAVAANDSRPTPEQLRQALAQAGLDGEIGEIFTVETIGEKKPAPAYFQAIARRLQADPARLVMIGDAYEKDILGAHQAGWRSLWFNPGHTPAPANPPPHDGEFAALPELFDLLQRPLPPTVEQCLAWLAEQRAPEGLLRHVELAAALAYRLAVWLRAAGHAVDPILAHRGGLLHDLAKITAREREGARLDHGEAAAQLLQARGCPELAQIAYRHILFTIEQPQRAPRTWEEKLVYFADKLAEGGQPVEIPVRMQAMRGRYPDDIANIDRQEPLVLALQEEIARAAGIPSADLVPRLRRELDTVTG